MKNRKKYTIEEIDDLLFKYRKYGKKDYLLELFNAFSGYIAKYANFLKFGKFKPKDKDIICLIGMLNNKNSSESGTDAIRIIFQNYSYDDIKSDLGLLFLKNVKQFVKRENGPCFTGYLYNYFKFSVRDWIRKISSDVFNTLKIDFIPDIINDMKLDWMTDDELLYDDYDSYNNADEKSDKFENLCMSDKTDLTNFEKYILYLSYGKKMRDYEIADIIDVQPMQINRIKLGARQKLVDSEMDLNDFII